MHYGDTCGFDPCYQGYGYGYPTAVGGVGVGRQNWFALIVVLFILLIIIGASCYGK
ncbi:YjcZ family sporulation protein [Bacillus sp. V3B]|uniref:YjcZ family sporulation protein n=1 Tax=Bacillus sp. V3B TaxID=2804915 RepID=UPI00210A372F|nr:YjcZ family sporulation protein [Bacillus sp. V3B]MCQ6277464.1 YjcZ family sporulation protein [Bacillus sp. V3B]